MNESLLFNLIKHNLVPDLEATDQYNPTDGTSIKKKLAIELKCRNTYYRYLLIEKKKYYKLIQYKNSRYINSIPNGDKIEIYSWNVKKLPNLRWHLKWLPETTEFGRKCWIEKEVDFIDREDAINLTKTLLSEEN
jgi:hypothetical protein